MTDEAKAAAVATATVAICFLGYFWFCCSVNFFHRSMLVIEMERRATRASEVVVFTYPAFSPLVIVASCFFALLSLLLE